MSLHVGPAEEFYSHSAAHKAANRTCQVSITEPSCSCHASCEKPHFPFDSVETAAGEPLQEFSSRLEDSKDYDMGLPVGHSLTLGTEASMDCNVSQEPFLPMLTERSRYAAQVVQRSAVTSVVEVPKLGSGLELNPGIQKRILRIARPPFHDCVAFDKAQYEKDRQGAHKDVLDALNPSTRLKFAALKSAGSFPRRVLVRSVPSNEPKSAREARQLPAAFMHISEKWRSANSGSGDDSGSITEETPPWDGEPPDGEMPPREMAVGAMQGEALQIAGAGARESCLSGSRSSSTRPFGSQEFMHDFFPASARAQQALSGGGA